MRRGIEAGLPQRQAHRTPVLLEPVQRLRTPTTAFAQNQCNCARFFLDLRRVLRVTPHQAAAELVTRVETIQALEQGQVAMLPPWPETARVVLSYAAWAGIDGRPVLSAIADMLREVQMVERQAIANQPALAPPPKARPAMLPQALQVERLRRASNALASGARRLPREAMAQVRKRPDRAFYAVSFPLVLMLLMLNTSVLQAAVAHIPGPLARAAEGVKSYLQVQFAPVRDGFRWINVDEPRKRRGDKLPINHR